MLNAKDNQPKLAEAIEEYIQMGEQYAWANLMPSQFETLDKGHGRVETRRCVALSVPEYIPEIMRWPGIKSIARIEAVREAQGKMTTEVRHLIGSMPPDAQVILSATRLHWGIENGLHRCLDMAFAKMPASSTCARLGPIWASYESWHSTYFDSIPAAN